MKVKSETFSERRTVQFSKTQKPFKTVYLSETKIAFHILFQTRNTRSKSTISSSHSNHGPRPKQSNHQPNHHNPTESQLQTQIGSSSTNKQLLQVEQLAINHIGKPSIICTPKQCHINAYDSCLSLVADDIICRL